MLQVFYVVTMLYGVHVAIVMINLLVLFEDEELRAR